MPGTRPAILALLLAVSAAAVGSTAVAGQQDMTTLTVSVTTPAGDPVADAAVTASWDGGSNTRTTQANGKLFISVPAGSDVELTIDHPDYVRNFPREVTDASEREVDVTVYRKSQIAVAVEGADGAVSGAEVAFRKGGRVVTTRTTDADGRVDSGIVEAGTYTLIVSKPGYFVARESLQAEGETATSIELERGTVTLEVNVTDDHFSPPRPVEGATVNVSQSGDVRTQPTGIGLISVPVNTWVDVRVTKSGYGVASDSVFVSESEASIAVTIQRVPDLRAELLSDRVVPGENVLVEVADEYGDPVAGATVRLDGEAVAETDAEGRAVLTVPSTGEHEVMVEHGDLQTGPLTVVGIEEGSAPTTAASTPTETGVDAPGFGPLVALVSIALLVLAAARRRR